MAEKKPALGRGLDALFGDVGTREIVKPDTKGEKGKGRIAKRAEERPASPGDAELFIDIDEIKPNTMQPRKAFDNEKMEELASSIELHGVISPVILRKAENGYELVAGERRWRAARKAGLKIIPATIREVTDEESAKVALIENLQREDLNTFEEASAYHAIIQKYGMTQDGLAREVGKSRPHIANTLRVLSMQEEIVDMIRRGELTLGHANALGAVKDEDQQLELAKKIVKSGLSVREAERLAARTDKRPAAKSAKSDEIRGVEQELTSATGIRVTINGNGRKGSVELRYFDRPGLEEIIELLRKAGDGRK